MVLKQWLRDWNRRENQQRVRTRRITDRRRGSCTFGDLAAVEILEDRTLLAIDIEVPLDAVLDVFGFQPETIQVFEDKVSLGAIFDTGASVVTFSALDQFLFDPFKDGTGIPIKIEGGAVAEGVGGILQGDVSEPGTILADGIHVSVFSTDIFGTGGGLYFDQLQGLGFVDDPSATTSQFRGNDRLNYEDDVYNGFSLLFTSTSPSSVTNLGESRLIADYDGTTRSFTLANGFQSAPAEGDTFHIIVDQGQVVGPLPGRSSFSGDSNLSDTAGIYIGRHVIFTSGELEGDVELISDYDKETHTFEVALPLDRRPEIGDTFDIIVGTGSSAVTPGVQVFVGTFRGSDVLPTISGTPMLDATPPPPDGFSTIAGPQPLHPDGLALEIGPQGFLLDLGELLDGLFPDGLFDGFIIPVPSLRFRDPGTQLEVSESMDAQSTVVDIAPTAGQFTGNTELVGDDPSFESFYNEFHMRFLTGNLKDEIRQITEYDFQTRSFTFADPFSDAPANGDVFELVRISSEPQTIALDFVGIDNHVDPGDLITISPNPVTNEVSITQGGVTLTNQNFLFDTGAQLTTITVDQALSLGFDLDTPEFTISVQGAAGVVSDLPGFTMDSFSIPTLEGGSFTFTDVPVFVIDVAEEIDGLWGMNLFNNAAEFLYDPFDPVHGRPTLQATFFNQRAEVVPEDIDIEKLDPVDAELLRALSDVLPLAAQGAIGLRKIQLPGFGVGVDLDLVPQTGTVTVGADGVTIVTVSPGTSIEFSGEIPFSAEFFDSFHLDFAGSDPGLTLHDWTTNSLWIASDGTLSSPDDTSVAADGEAALSTTLGSFVADVPQTPGDYRLTANDGFGATAFSLTGLADPLAIRDFGDIVIRVQDVPKLSIGDETLIEGVDGEVTGVEFTVFLTGESAGTITVDYATGDGSALVMDGDYNSNSGSLNFAPGVTEQTITVAVNGDGDVETDENFFVNLSGATISFEPLTSTPWGDVTGINQGGSPPTFTLEGQDEIELRTGSSPTIRAFALEFDLRDIPAGVTIDSATLHFVDTIDTIDDSFEFLRAAVYGYTGFGSVDGSENGIVDETVFESLISNQLGSIGDGTVGTETVDVTAFIQSLFGNGDDFAGVYVESPLDEYGIHSSEAVNSSNRPTLTFQFSTASVSVEISDPQAELTIRNDDTQISISDRELVEGDNGEKEAIFVVQLAEPSAVNVSVSYATSAGTAAAGSDFQPVDGVLAFAAGQTTKSIIVPIIGDNQLEPNETFNVNLFSSVNAGISDAEGIGTILNDDPQISIDDVSLTEGDSGETNFTFTISIAELIALDVNVDFATADDSSVAADDYTAISGTATITAGATSITVTVKVQGDTTVEPDETFFVNLSNPVNATIADNQGLGTINNDDLGTDDFGDAPLPYPTTLAENGARHTASGLTLGVTRDAESDGTHSAAADADGADEDGVTFGTMMVGALGATLTVNVQGAAGKLDAWIDFNGDRSWGGPGEKIFAAKDVVAGDNNLTFDVPSFAIAGTTYARFRVSTAGSLGVIGLAADGEVEDYQVTINNPVASSGLFGGQTTISTSADGAFSVFAADVDGDGDMDLLSASQFDDTIAWYENDGSQSFTPHTISMAADGAVSVFAVDVDGDGDMDVLSASLYDNKIAWYENDGSQNFTEHAISTAAVFAISVFAADVDSDGDLDVLSASFGDDTIAWYENDGSQNFTPHTISMAADFAISVFAADVDGDGDLDVLSASLYDNKIAWYENNGSGGFMPHTISTSANGATSVFAADVDGDGDLDVLSTSLYDDTIAWYENDGSQSFTPHTISTAADGAYSVFAADVDGDGDIDVLSASLYDNKIAWYENDGSQSFTPHTISTATDGAFSLFVADVDGDGDLDVLSASGSDDKIAWYENDPGTDDFGDAPVPYPTTLAEDGARHVATGLTLGLTRDAESNGAHSVAADADGVDEDGVTFQTMTVGALGAKLTVNVQGAAGKLDAWIDFDGDGSWGGTDEQIFASQDVVVGNNNLTFDVPSSAVAGTTYARFRISTSGGLGVSGAAADGEVEDYQVTISDPVVNTGHFGVQNMITTAADGAVSVFAADVDGDGDMDLLSASSYDDTIAWYENDGNQNFTQHSISTTAVGAQSVFAADVDGDGDMDLLSASAGDDKIAWYNNDGSENFTEHTITTAADAAESVFAADVDGDGDMDVLSASVLDDKIAWYENDGSQNFTLHTITTDADAAVSVFAADVDGDGDIDVLSASVYDDRIAWYENDGSQNFTPHTITTLADYALSVFAADVDSDGDLDVLSASLGDSKIAWYENDGSQNFTPHTISTAAIWAYSVYAADVDGDGDVDVLSASFFDNKIAWYENDGSQNFTTHTISTEANGAQSVFAADVDSDGDLDVLSASAGDDKIAWYENLGNDVITTNLDVDANGEATALTDGVLIVRYLFGVSGTQLTDGALGTGATRTDPDEIIAFLDPGLTTMLDVDLNGEAGALTDGVLIVRYLFGVTGTQLTDGALGTGAVRTDAAEIIAFLDGFLPAAASASFVVSTQDVLIDNYDETSTASAADGTVVLVRDSSALASPSASRHFDAMNAARTTGDFVLPPIDSAPLLYPVLTKEEPDDESLVEEAPVIVPEEQAELDTLFGDLGGSLQDELLTV
jgi:hypothetical protein